MRPAKRAETSLIVDGIIRVALVEGSAGGAIPVALAGSTEHSQQDQAGLVIRLIEGIDMHPLAQVAQVADVARDGVELVRRWDEAVLDRQPFVVIRQIARARKS